MAKVASEQTIAALSMEPRDEDEEEEEKIGAMAETGSVSSISVVTQGPPLDAAPPRIEGLRKQSSYKNENPWNRPRTGKKISFVDEGGSNVPLHEITYSKFTHYSRVAQTQAVPPPPGGCCVLQ
ncbi:hypothetical protein LEN26_020706 [Aphanomyces euteiches]|nr:hypothetical protein LEN26_020706 [Aphanomyces euteiches]KAH9129128.1 hypothetical protein AeMF1_000783 [Aphanomyces euteiches]KAH9189694.1 hypothetical protein AeNC1_008328 [Aphanomyces euteiches]